jgi:hypothetical protein
MLGENPNWRCASTLTVDQSCVRNYTELQSTIELRTVTGKQRFIEVRLTAVRKTVISMFTLSLEEQEPNGKQL